MRNLSTFAVAFGIEAAKFFSQDISEHGCAVIENYAKGYVIPKNTPCIIRS